MDKSLAILIDCWETDFGGSNHLYQRILDYIDQSDFITTVVLASYDCRREQNTKSSIWYYTLGYLSLSEIPNINILTNTDCVLDDQASSPNLDELLDWKSLGDKIYQYIPGK